MTPPFAGRPPRLLRSVWLVTAGLTAPPALLLQGSAENTRSGLAAFLLLLCTGMALAAGVVVRSGSRRAHVLSLAASAAVVLAGGCALVLLAAGSRISTVGLLMFGGCAVAGALVCAAVAGARLQQAPPLSPPS